MVDWVLSDPFWRAVAGRRRVSADEGVALAGNGGLELQVGGIRPAVLGTCGNTAHIGSLKQQRDHVGIKCNDMNIPSAPRASSQQ